MEGSAGPYAEFIKMILDPIVAFQSAALSPPKTSRRLAQCGLLRDAQRFAANDLWGWVNGRGALAIHPSAHVVLTEEIGQRF